MEREELRGLKNSALQKKARELGVADEALDDASDAPDPREVLHSTHSTDPCSPLLSVSSLSCRSSVAVCFFCRQSPDLKP